LAIIAITAEVDRLWDHVPMSILGNLTLEAFENSRDAIYIFLTKQPIQLEVARFLTQRGPRYNAAGDQINADFRNRPVLVTPAGHVLNRPYLVNMCGLKSEFIHTSKLRFNEAKIEAASPSECACTAGSVMGATMLNSKTADLTALTMVGITVFKLSGNPALAGTLKIGGRRVCIQPSMPTANHRSHR